MRLPVFAIKDLEVVDSNLDFDWVEEIYSVRRRKDTPESENFGLPREDKGLSRARS